MLLQTQWKTDAGGKPDGIDYTAAKAAIDLMRVPGARRPELFHGIQIMEFAAMEIFGG